MAQRRTNRRLRKAAEGAGLLFERPYAGEFCHRSQKRGAAFGDAQTAHQCCCVFAEIVRFFGLDSDLVEQRVGAFFDEAGQETPLLDRKPAQKRAVAKNRGE